MCVAESQVKSNAIRAGVGEIRTMRDPNVYPLTAKVHANEGLCQFPPL